MERYARAFFKKLSLFTAKTIKSYLNRGHIFWRRMEERRSVNPERGKNMAKAQKYPRQRLLPRAF
jgi:hypothetical protein